MRWSRATVSASARVQKETRPHLAAPQRLRGRDVEEHAAALQRVHEQPGVCGCEEDVANHLVALASLQHWRDVQREAPHDAAGVARAAGRRCGHGARRPAHLHLRVAHTRHDEPRAWAHHLHAAYLRLRLARRHGAGDEDVRVGERLVARDAPGDSADAFLQRRSLGHGCLVEPGGVGLVVVERERDSADALRVAAQAKRVLDALLEDGRSLLAHRQPV